ncbi:hypothetical protein V6N13_078845 [Hibiscus sabdariffa]
MALYLLPSVPITSFITKHTKATNLHNSAVLRAPRFIAAIADDSDQNEESFKEQATRLVGEVRMMLEKEMEPLEKLELIDTLQRLGLSYHFQNETKKILEEAFSIFQDEMGNFNASLCEDGKGLLSLYEASFLSVEEEGILDTARAFAAQHLQQQKLDEHLRMLVEHALELPLHWKMSRLEARWFIDLYEKREEKNLILLELAKLDFNIVQAVHQDDIRYSSKWWMDTGLGEKLRFARDRLMEHCLWTMGYIFDPQCGNIRRSLTKVHALITAIDDVYGTLDELELFTQAVDRWDVNAMQLLPQYLQICFLALFNSVNEMAYDNLKEHGFHTLDFLKKAVSKAREYVRKSIDATWKRMNGEYLSMAHSTSSPMFIQIAFSMARMAQCMYQYGDGHGVADQEAKHRVKLLLVSSIP